MKEIRNLLLLFFCLFFILIGLAFLDIEVKKESSNIKIYDGSTSLIPSEYPVIVNSYDPQVSATGAIVVDNSSKRILYSKNSDFRLLPASTTKILTALTALEYFKEDEVLTVRRLNNEGSILGLKPGDRMTFENLLYAMLLPSANDAATTIADNFPGGEVAFVSRMNQVALELNMVNSHFEDPDGISDNNYTTPYDLSILSAKALENNNLAGIVATKDKTINDLSGKEYKISNLNILLGSRGVEGIKTGFTEEAGQVLLTAEEKKIGSKKKTFLIVVMQSDDRFGDTENLLDFLNNNVNYLAIRP